MKKKLTKEELDLVKAVIKKRNSFKYARKPSLFMKFMSYTGLYIRGREVHRFYANDKSYNSVFIVNLLNPIAWVILTPYIIFQVLLSPLTSSYTISESIKDFFDDMKYMYMSKMIWYKGRLFIINQGFLASKDFNIFKIKLELGLIKSN